MKRIITLLVLVLAMVISLASCNSARYNDALALIEEGKYDEAYEALAALGSYKDAEELLSRFRYVPVTAKFESEDGSYSIEFFYDSDNMPLRNILIDQDGHEHTSEYTYDENKDLIKEFFIDYNNGETTYTYTYDENRNLIKEVYDHAQGEYHYIESEYDELGRVTKVVTYYTDMQLDVEYFYDESGRAFKEVYTFGEETTVHEFTFDENGNKISATATDSLGTSTTTEYVYDENGRLVKEFEMGGEEELFSVIFTYDEDGNLTKEEATFLGETFYVYEYTYDENGNVIKLVYTDGDGKTETTEKEFKLVYIEKEVTKTIEKVLEFDYL